MSRIVAAALLLSLARPALAVQQQDSVPPPPPSPGPFKFDLNKPPTPRVFAPEIPPALRPGAPVPAERQAPPSRRDGTAAPAPRRDSARAPGRDGGTAPSLARRVWDRLPVDFEGTTTTMAELYRHGGATTARRPAGVWRVSASPQLTLLGELRMRIEALLSSEGSRFRQNTDQVGFNPTWRWVTAHTGDFARDYTSLTMQGTRIRGFGMDLQPGRFEMSVQGGRAQRTVAAGSDVAAYRRDIVAALVAYGRRGGNRVSITVVKAKDDPNSLEQQLVIVDSTVTDTSLSMDPLRFAVTPQENLVVGISTGLNLLKDAVRFDGQAGASLFTRDLRSQVVGDAGVGALGGVSALHPLRLSTSGDFAFEGQVSARLGTGSLRAGYEQVGPGYTSLGLPSLISDRAGFNLGGNVSLFGGRLALSGDTRQQKNNLVDQKTAATERSMNTASLLVALTPAVQNTLSIATSSALTLPTAAAPGMDMGTLSVTTGLNARVTLLGKATALSISYAYQTSEDAWPGSVIPRTVGHNVSAGVTATLTPRISLGPTVSAVTNRSGAAESQDNVLLGFQVRARMLSNDRLTLSGNLSNTFSSGRQVQAARAELGYRLPWDARLSVQLRHSNYAAFASKPAFNESFLTTTVTRSLRIVSR